MSSSNSFLVPLNSTPSFRVTCRIIFVSNVSLETHKKEEHADLNVQLEDSAIKVEDSCEPVVTQKDNSSTEETENPAVSNSDMVPMLTHQNSIALNTKETVSGMVNTIGDRYLYTKDEPWNIVMSKLTKHFRNKRQLAKSRQKGVPENKIVKKTKVTTLKVKKKREWIPKENVKSSLILTCKEIKVSSSVRKKKRAKKEKSKCVEKKEVKSETKKDQVIKERKEKRRQLKENEFLKKQEEVSIRYTNLLEKFEAKKVSNVVAETVIERKQRKQIKEVINTVESNPRKYNYDFSESLSNIEDRKPSKETSLGKHKLREKIENVLIINGDELDDQQKEIFKDLINYAKNTKAFQCTMCDKTFGTHGSMKSHRQAEHRARKKIKWKCRRCKIEFKNKTIFEFHKKQTHDPDKEHACTECDKMFKTVTAYKIHTQAVHEGVKLECKLCEKRFSFQSNLRRHLSTVHTDLKPYKCKECDKCFGLSGNLKRHESIQHLKIRHPCPDCQKECLDKGDLSRHRREKHGDTPLTCEDCGLDFTTFYGLSQHVNIKHKEVPTIYPCDLCDRRNIFSSQQRSQHKIEAHGKTWKQDARSFKCTTCKQIFASKLERIYHMKKVHDVERIKYTCKKCRKHLNSEIRLKIHAETCKVLTI